MMIPSQFKTEKARRPARDTSTSRWVESSVVQRGRDSQTAR